MKKLFLILILMLVIGLASCNVETTTNENDKVASSDINITKVTYEGHEYLIFREGSYDRSTAGFTHSGNCPCIKNDSIINK